MLLLERKLMNGRNWFNKNINVIKMFVERCKGKCKGKFRYVIIYLWII